MRYEGSWQGSNGLRMLPEEEFDRSGATAQVRMVGGGLATQIDYTWEHGGEPQSGMLLVNAVDGAASAVFLDTFHQAPGWLMMSGTASADGFEVAATYAPGFDWIIAVRWLGDRWEMSMSNALAGTGAYVAVDMRFHR